MPMPPALQRLYWSPQWKRLRRQHLAREPLCRRCLALTPPIVNDGSVDPATGRPQANPRLALLHVDHIRPHRGNPMLFLDPANLQTLCAPHHNAKSTDEGRAWQRRQRQAQRDTERGHSTAGAADGWPADPRHPVFDGRGRAAVV